MDSHSVREGVHEGRSVTCPLPMSLSGDATCWDWFHWDSPVRLGFCIDKVHEPRDPAADPTLQSFAVGRSVPGIPKST